MRGRYKSKTTHRGDQTQSLKKKESEEMVPQKRARQFSKKYPRKAQNEPTPHFSPRAPRGETHAIKTYSRLMEKNSPRKEWTSVCRNRKRGVLTNFEKARKGGKKK